ncbi:hypothetical protein KIN20_013089 [Parelaphostrongylus tenuis]|uniref:Uncharacterized protein n=1 Tax=Parelaphostrongylus tenuis TaxID=148309 RepID=A0AAD5MG47_PARTN|nr:hypothetical protein KIN20_013089 [Parelaphostrongylus tenuis]
MTICQLCQHRNYANYAYASVYIVPESKSEDKISCMTLRNKRASSQEYEQAEGCAQAMSPFFENFARNQTIASLALQSTFRERERESRLVPEFTHIIVCSRKVPLSTIPTNNNNITKIDKERERLIQQFNVSTMKVVRPKSPRGVCV